MWTELARPLSYDCTEGNNIEEENRQPEDGGLGLTKAVDRETRELLTRPRSAQSCKEAQQEGP
jgi:hypothetical protein